MELMVDLSGGGDAPLYEKIYRRVREEIASGRVQKGARLPSTRRLAESLSVSRSTVDLAYAQLLAEGYIRSEPRSGYFACDIAELFGAGGAARPASGGAGGKSRVLQAEQPACGVKPGSAAPRELPRQLADFSPYSVDTEHFPFGVWRKISRMVLSSERRELLLPGDGCGEWELRDAIADYLHQARGVNCQAGDVIIGAGNEYLELLLVQILGGGKTILMEDPGYPQAYETFRNAGCAVRTVAAGTLGADGGALRELSPDVVYAMPSHQFPEGSIMPLSSRIELLRWAAEGEGRYVIEDDHDGEYRYQGKPIPSLQGIDHEGRVIYLGTFSKSIAPSIRVSYMVLPPRLMEAYRRSFGFYSATVPRIHQEILLEFIRGGHFERHLNRMRGIYRGRNDFLVSELAGRRWAAGVSGERAGLHLLVSVDSKLSEREICVRAREMGLAVSGLGEYCLAGGGAGRAPALLLGYGAAGEDEIKMGLSILDEVMA